MHVTSQAQGGQASYEQEELHSRVLGVLHGGGHRMRPARLGMGCPASGNRTLVCASLGVVHAGCGRAHPWAGATDGVCADFAAPTTSVRALRAGTTFSARYPALHSSAATNTLVSTSKCNALDQVGCRDGKTLHCGRCATYFPRRANTARNTDWVSGVCQAARNRGRSMRAGSSMASSRSRRASRRVSRCASCGSASML